MNLIRKSFRSACILLAANAVVSAGVGAFAQVSSTEVKNPRAKADEQKYMPQLVSLQKSIGAATFPFTFRLARYLDARPGQRAALDSNGLEFVVFQDKVVLKVSGFYRVAFNAMQVTQNGRASQTLQQAVLPILRMITEEMPQSYDYDAIGFEILYDARDSSGAYDYEGHEVLTAVFGRDDAFALVNSPSDEARQEILNHSDMFVNGKEFAVALGAREPFDLAAVDRSASPGLKRASFVPAKAVRPTMVADSVSPDVSDVQTARHQESSSADFDVAGMQQKLQAEVSAVRDGGEATFDQAGTIAPSLETNGDQHVLHFTMQNTLAFDRGPTSIYKRAAQSFDLFLAPELKNVAKRVPADASVDALHFSVLNRTGAGKSETIEYICPLDSLRSFVENKITTQELINKSVVLVNGVRIGVDLQLVE
ncbi:MAG TPA: hypothetical protein VGL00_01410 [Terracidiphilus sp.]